MTEDRADRPAPQIEVTPEMIEAGMDAYDDFDPEWGSLGGVLADVFVEMAREAGLVAVYSERLQHRYQGK